MPPTTVPRALCSYARTLHNRTCPYILYIACPYILMRAAYPVSLPVAPQCEQTIVFTYLGHVRRYCSELRKLRSLFHGRKFLKLLKRRTMDQAVPLSVGSKLELLLSCQISVYFPVHSRICPRMHICHVYTCILATCIYNVHDRGAEGFAL